MQLAIKRCSVFSPRPMSASVLLHYLGKEKQRNMCCNLQKKHQKTSPTLLTITSSVINRFQLFLAQIFPTQLAIKLLFKFPPHPMYVSVLHVENRPNKIHVEMNEKTSINFVYPDL